MYLHDSLTWASSYEQICRDHSTQLLGVPVSIAESQPSAEIPGLIFFWPNFTCGLTRQSSLPSLIRPTRVYWSCSPASLVNIFRLNRSPGSRFLDSSSPDFNFSVSNCLVRASKPDASDLPSEMHLHDIADSLAERLLSESALPVIRTHLTAFLCRLYPWESIDYVNELKIPPVISHTCDPTKC